MVFQTRSNSLKSCIEISFAIWGPFSQGPEFSVLRVLYRSIYPIDPLLEGCKRNHVVFTELSSLSLIVVHCHPDCLTCSQSPDHCDLCQDPTKMLRNGRCVHSCGLGFYQAGALCLGTAPGRQPRGGLRLTGVQDGVMAQEMNNFQKPLEGSSVIRRLLDLSTCKSLSSNI